MSIDSSETDCADPNVPITICFDCKEPIYSNLNTKLHFGQEPIPLHQECMYGFLENIKMLNESITWACSEGHNVNILYGSDVYICKCCKKVGYYNIDPKKLGKYGNVGSQIGLDFEDDICSNCEIRRLKKKCNQFKHKNNIMKKTPSMVYPQMGCFSGMCCCSCSKDTIFGCDCKSISQQ